MNLARSSDNALHPGAQDDAPASLLAQQQHALLDALFSRPPGRFSATAAPASPSQFTGTRGLQAYQAHGHAQAERSLLAAYPVLAQLLGEESFGLLAHDFWHAHPPQRGDLAQWGSELPAFIAPNPQLADEPYLADVARVEWALHQAAGAADVSPNPASFALLSEHEPDTLTLVLAPGTWVLSSNFPVASIVSAHLSEHPSLEQAGQLLRAGVHENTRVWRQGFKPRLAKCSPQEAAFLRALQSGASLLRALEIAGEFNLAPWLPQAVQAGLVLGAVRQKPD